MNAGGVGGRTFGACPGFHLENASAGIFEVSGEETSGTFGAPINLRCFYPNRMGLGGGALFEDEMICDNDFFTGGAIDGNRIRFYLALRVDGGKKGVKHIYLKTSARRCPNPSRR